MVANEPQTLDLSPVFEGMASTRERGLSLEGNTGGALVLGSFPWTEAFTPFEAPGEGQDTRAARVQMGIHLFFTFITPSLDLSPWLRVKGPSGRA